MLCKGMGGGNRGAGGLFAAIFQHLADDLDFDLAIYGQVLTSLIIEALARFISPPPQLRAIHLKRMVGLMTGSSKSVVSSC